VVHANAKAPMAGTVQHRRLMSVFTLGLACSAKDAAHGSRALAVSHSSCREARTEKAGVGELFAEPTRYTDHPSE
jgi:hypothetical protein